MQRGKMFQEKKQHKQSTGYVENQKLVEWKDEWKGIVLNMIGKVS